MAFVSKNGSLHWVAARLPEGFLLGDIPESRMVEMANLDPRETGFRFFIWVGFPDPRHGGRVKVMNEPGRVDINDCFSLSITDNPSVVAGHCKIPAKDLKQIKKWIKLNKEILTRHSRMEISDYDLRMGLKTSSVGE